MEGLSRRDDLDGALVGLLGDLLATVGAVPFCLLEPVKAAGKRGETDAHEAEDGAREAGESCKHGAGERLGEGGTYNWRPSPLLTTLVLARLWHIWQSMNSTRSLRRFRGVTVWVWPLGSMAPGPTGCMAMG